VASTGARNKDVAARLGIDPATVGKWRRRFLAARVDGLHDEPRSGTPRTITDDRIEAVIVKTLESAPAGATDWSSRNMARVAGLSVSSVQRIWRAFGLQPHRSETFKLSIDPLFVKKVRDIVGLYVSPPERAIVLCVDEKSQIQALDRSQPLLPMCPGQAERRALTTRATALHPCSLRSTSPPAASSANAIRAIARPSFASIASRPRFQPISISTSVHLTPTGASWLNQVERFFALLAERQIKRGVHCSVTALEAAINAIISNHNTSPKPSTWTSDDILASIERFCTRTLAIQNARNNF
jgi:transposase